MSEASFASHSGGGVAANTSVSGAAAAASNIIPTPIATNINTSSMSTNTTSSSAEHSAGTKPRLSLLSTTKQSGVRLKSEDSADQQITILSVGADEYATNIVNTNPTTENEKRSRFQREAAAETTNKSFKIESESQQPQQLVRNTLQPQTSEDNKMNISNEDLLRLLSILKSELHSKEIALAAIKCEQLKRLINPVEISRSSLANTYMELQDRFRLHDQQDSNNNATKEAEQRQQKQQSQQPKSASAKEQAEDFMKMYIKGQEIDDSDKENLNILNTLLELLDRHPLLALPRDSIYCLDYNCNELSTKNYLNLKIQHLDNLINQHRRFRYYMNERLKRSEQRYLDLTQELELERNLKAANEKSLYRTSGKTVLIKHIDQLKEDLEKVKKDKQAIVMTLLNDLLDNRERIESLEQKLAGYEAASVKSIENSADAQQKLIALEAQLNSVNIQLKKQTVVSAKEKSELQSKADRLEAENAALKTKLEQQEIRLAALSKSTTNDNKESPGHRPQVAPKLIGHPDRQTAGGPTESTNQRNSSSAVSMSTKSSNTKSSSTSTQGPSSRAPTQNNSNNSSPHTSIPPKPVLSSSMNKPGASPAVASRTAGLINTETAPVRVQPLFKSASVLSTNQQVRNLKSSASVGSSAGTNSASPRTASTNNQPVTKPQVPAKPAQLWEQQRNSIN